MENKLKENPLELFWKRRIEEGISEVAIFNSGDCIVVSLNGKVYYFNKNGNVLWKLDTIEICGNIPISAYTPVLRCSDEDDVIALVYPEEHIYYIFNKSGQFLSKYENKDILNFDISLSNGYVVTSSKDGKIYIFDKNKNKLWEYATNSKAIVCISHYGEYIVAGSEKGRIYFFNKHGQLLWERNLKSNIFQISLSPCGEYLAVCFGEKKDNLYFFDKRGKLLWDYKNELINIKIEGISSSGQCIISGLKLTTPKHDKIITVEDREYVVHVQDAYTTQICYFENNEQKWKLEGDEWRLRFSGIVVSPEFEYISFITSKRRECTFEIWFVNRNGEIIWKYKMKDEGYGTDENGFIDKITKDGKYVAAMDLCGSWYLFNKKGLLFKHTFDFDESTLTYLPDTEYGRVRISTNGKYIVTQYGNCVQLFIIKIQ